jgi:hypothetical protein
MLLALLFHITLHIGMQSVSRKSEKTSYYVILKVINAKMQKYAVTIIQIYLSQ